jgi:hypothetical protein
MPTTKFCVVAIAAIILAIPAHATVTAITNRNQWINAVDTHTYIGFTGHPKHTIITTQYADQGVLFTDGNDVINLNATLPGDGASLTSVDFTPPFGGNVHMSFPLERNAIAFDFIGSLYIEFYNRGSLVFASNHYFADFTPFVGFISDASFDAVIAYDGDDEVVVINNLLFGPAVPAPATLSALLIAALGGSTRRRRT